MNQTLLHLYLWQWSIHYLWVCVYIRYQWNNLGIWFIDAGGGLVARLCPTPATPWTVVCQAPLFMGFSRQECWSGVAISSYRGSSQPKHLPCISFTLCIGRWILYHPAKWEAREDMWQYKVIMKTLNWIFKYFFK